MQDHNAQIVADFLKHKDEIGDDIMVDIENMLGAMPFIFSVIRERADAFVLSTLAN